MRLGVGGGEPNHAAAHVGAPARREEPAERGHEVHVLIRWDRQREGLRLGRRGRLLVAKDDNGGNAPPGHPFPRTEVDSADGPDGAVAQCT